MAYQAELLEEWMRLERLNPECKAGAPATQDTKQWGKQSFAALAANPSNKKKRDS